MNTTRPMTSTTQEHVCPNCEQWQHETALGYFDCMNGCAERGFAPKITNTGAINIEATATLKDEIKKLESRLRESGKQVQRMYQERDELLSKITSLEKEIEELNKNWGNA